MKAIFENVKLGDSVYDIVDGVGQVTEIRINIRPELSGIEVTFDKFAIDINNWCATYPNSGPRFYRFNGVSISRAERTLYKSKPTILEQ